jgi:glycosyltransferase involved in cell wall biosynthesis
VEIVRSYDDPRIVLLDRPHRGFAASLNEGIRESRGRYIARMDADDIATEDRLALQHEFMEDHADVGLLGKQAVLIDECGNTQGELRRSTTAQDIARHIEYACPVIHSTYFARRAVFEATEGYRSIPPVEDYDFLFRAHEAGFSLRNSPEMLVQYRATPDGMTLKNLQRAIVFCLEVQKMHRLRTTTQRRDNVDLIHSHHRFSTIVGQFVMRLTGVPIVATVHEYKTDWRWLTSLWRPPIPYTSVI